MDAASIERAKADLAAWGLVDDGQPTRRLRAAWMRASASLASMEKQGKAVAGHPVRNIAAGALEETVPGKWSAEHRDLLAAIHLAGLPEAVADIVGRDGHGP